ncbi:MAG TPA: helix-turn-helix domain-containing protein [Baekduia sp.]|uniref:ArsR/SmtB family transcription factor n=1 Tax=Baekduia sp. TaxID=2600305 RepID=UPI002CDD4731|nr:helix-turn-helix domain-containing protein [Baekduia sp.]HMJ35893.1 helix-turn-helix domain-containing protein [Baekduia sp.]
MAEPVSANVLRALSHPVRLALLVALERDELTAAALAERLGLTPPETATQLAVLREAGLVTDGRRPGRLRTTTHGWATIDAQLRRLGAAGTDPD